LVPRSQITPKQLYNLEVTGEILKDDHLFETYRYRFDYPLDSGDKLPVVIDRLLPGGEFEARIRIADVNSKAEAIVEQSITVPSAGGAAAAGAKPKGEEIVLRLVPLPDELLDGPQHVSTITSADVAAVEFSLDGK